MKEASMKASFAQFSKIDLGILLLKKQLSNLILWKCFTIGPNWILRCSFV